MDRRGKILVVDDDEAVRLRVRDILATDELCEVREADSGSACLASVGAEPPDLILLDIMMPGMSGLEVCFRLRGDPATREIPIIILSAADADTARPDALEAGAEDYLVKPIRARELKAKVNVIMRLNRYRSLRQERDRLRWLFEHAREPLVRIGCQGRLIEANLRARELFSLPLAPSESEPAPDALAMLEREHRTDPPDAFARLREGRPPQGFSLHRPETSLSAACWYEVRVHKDEATPSADLMLMLVDRSEHARRQMETWSFHHLISHKLRTPLNGVGGLLDALLDVPENLANEEARELALGARECASRLEGTLLSILRYHKIFCEGAEGAGSAPQSFDALWRDAAAEAGVKPWQTRLSGAEDLLLPPAMIEPARMVLCELAVNYLKFADVAHGGIDAHFERRGRHAALRLFAPGPALPTELIARLGRPYWQIEKQFTGEVPGTGLGLATCRLLLASLGGELRFSADAARPGLVCQILLPLPT